MAEAIYVTAPSYVHAHAYAHAGIFFVEDMRAILQGNASSQVSFYLYVTKKRKHYRS